MKKLIGLFSILCLLFSTGCGSLNPSKVDEKYVIEKMTKSLKFQYGTDFVINIVSFNSNSETREALAESYPKIDPSLKFEVNGSIEKDYFSGSVIGSSYHINDKFSTLLLDKINSELTSKYSFELIGNNNYKDLAYNVRKYLEEFRIMLSNYKDGNDFHIYFSDEYERANIPFTKNGELLNHYSNEVIIDKSNDKVVIDTSKGKYGWIGELDLEYYLELLSTDKLDEYYCKSRCEHYKPNKPCDCY